jgi:hypothetical protein
MSRSFEHYSWEDHLTQASGLVTLISVAARALEDLQAQAALLSISHAIEDQIDLAIQKVSNGQPSRSAGIFDRARER